MKINLSQQLKPVLDEFEEMAKKAQFIAIFTRDIELQKDEIESLLLYISKLENIKLESKDKYTDIELNLLACMIISIEAIQQELSMIISLKENDMDKAWESLIQAQNSIAIAARNHPISEKFLKGYISKLEAYEQILFPKMVFASVGGIIKECICSICEMNYHKCDHMAGKVYKGELCVCTITKMDVEEFSIVENPADKRCRNMSVDFRGENVDVFTLLKK